MSDTSSHTIRIRPGANEYVHHTEVLVFKRLVQLRNVTVEEPPTIAVCWSYRDDDEQPYEAACSCGMFMLQWGSHGA